ncbi:MAG: ATP-binding protein [Desulfobacteraceae bacterium]|nr:ATP-binding protein [Desulfobacteraceae bacterium]
MIKENLKTVIQEFHESPLPYLFERESLFDFSILDAPINKVITIIGPRRAGKTYYLFQIIKNLLKKRLHITDIIYINFEDERILPMEGTDLQYILDAYYELYEKKDRPFIFLDEIQNIIDWERFVRRLNDQGHQIFITGSNSRMLGREIATALRGRTLTYEIFPFSFKEFITIKGMKPGKNLIYGKMRHRIRSLYEEYFFSGGYPEITLIEDKMIKGQILQDYFNAIFYKDLVDRHSIKNSELLRQLLNTLMMNLSALISFSKIENDFKSRGMKLSRATLSSFAGYIQDTFFGFFVEMYSESVRKRQINPKKFYLIDVGMHNYLTLRFSENKGRLLENLVFLELKRRGVPIFYYKTNRGHEVDFLINNKGNWDMIQVCYDLTHVDVFSREKKALISGLNEVGIDTGTIITDNEKRVVQNGKNALKIIPIWEWLLLS